jgi:hypothetical protein
VIPGAQVGGDANIAVVVPRVGAAVAVFVCVWCCGHSHCAVWMLQVPSLHCMWCHSHSQALHGVVVAVILLCVMLQSWWLALEGEEGHTSVGKGGGRWQKICKHA